MAEKIRWKCIGQNPTTWGLCVYKDKHLSQIMGKTTRQDDGKWLWELFIDGWPTQGYEPSRILSMGKAQIHYKKWLARTRQPNKANQADPDSLVSGRRVGA